MADYNEEYIEDEEYSGKEEYIEQTEPELPPTPGLKFKATGGTYTVTRYDGTDTEVYIPPIYNGKPVTAIGYRAFWGCKSLKSVTIPEGVTEIGEYAFSECKSLKSITLPEGVAKIGGDAFNACRRLGKIAVSEKNPHYKSQDGVLYSMDGKLIICYPAGKEGTSYAISEGVTEIGDSAFRGCESLKSITLPEGVTEIGEYAFCGCKSLVSITLPEGVTGIGVGAFEGCESLKSITLPEGVTAIGGVAFWGCESLKKIIIPKGVTEIGDYAFFYCHKLTIYCRLFKPFSGWNKYWNRDKRPVKWGYKGE